MRSREIKLEAAESINGYQLALFVPVFILSLAAIVSEIFILLNLAYLIVLPPLNYGVTSVYLKRRNGEAVNPFDFFGEGFSNFGRAWVISLRIFLKFLLPIIVLIVGIFALAFVGVSSSIASPTLVPSIEPSGMTVSAMSSIATRIFGMLIWGTYLACFVWFIPLYYKYRYAYNEAIMNPDASTKEVMQKTAEVMKGNKWKSFCLDFSYIPRALGSVILASFIGIFVAFISELVTTLVVSAVVVYLYNMYFTMSHVIFYEDKRKEKFGAPVYEAVAASVATEAIPASVESESNPIE